MTFTLEHETDYKINFLNDILTRRNNKGQFSTFRKHDNTDSVMPSDLCLLSGHKYSAIRD
jgi:hypothetical protein